MALPAKSLRDGIATISRRLQPAGSAIVLLVIATAALSCASKGAAILGRDASRDVLSETDGMSTAAPTDSADLTEEVGRTMAGVYMCCAPNEGSACCAGTAQGMCFKYGGTAGRCLQEGELFDGKDICAVCCSGLSRIQPDELPDGGADCQRSAPPSIFICVKCGDGVCGEFENRCRCAADCP